MKPQLAASADLPLLPRLTENKNWWAEQKLDGHRVVLEIRDGRLIKAFNRSGDSYGNRLPLTLANGPWPPGPHWQLDGELLDGHLWLFDLPLGVPVVFPSLPYSYRRTAMEVLMQRWSHPRVKLVPVARTLAEKTALAGRVAEANGEGVVFKHVEGVYEQGRRNPKMLKVKFVTTADLVVTRVGREGKESIGVGAFHEGRLVEIGACSTIGKPAVSPGDVVEVRYLYATNDLRLSQPVLLRRREDKRASECTTDQLKFVNKNVLLPEETA